VVPINTTTYPQEAFDRLWDKLQGADYAFEDSTRGDKVRFVQNMLAPATYNFELPDQAFGQLVNAYPGSNAAIHFVTLDAVPTTHLVGAAGEIFGFAFDQLGVHRLTAYIPEFNQRVTRMASLLRMKFEGSMRSTFLYHEEYWDLHIYGLLDGEWKRRN
jgi:hypothetical protein